MKVCLLSLLTLAALCPTAFGQMTHDRAPSNAKRTHKRPPTAPRRLTPPPRLLRDLNYALSRRALKMPLPRGTESEPWRRPFAPRKSAPRTSIMRDVATQEDDFSTAAVYKEIKGTRPAINNAALRCDEEVIRASLPEIQKAYAESGLTREGAQAAALAAWKEVRLTSPLQPYKCMVPASYVNFTLSLGTIWFKSKPALADIYVDGKKLGQTVHGRLYEDQQKVRVKYSLNGHAPVEVECTAVARTNTDCYAELKPLP